MHRVPYFGSSLRPRQVQVATAGTWDWMLVREVRSHGSSLGLLERPLSAIRVLQHPFVSKVPRAIDSVITVGLDSINACFLLCHP